MLDRLKKLLGGPGATHNRETDTQVGRILPGKPFATALLAALDSSTSSGHPDPTRRVAFVHTDSIEADLAAAVASASAHATMNALPGAGIDWPKKGASPTPQFMLATSFGFLIAAVMLVAIQEEGFVVERDEALRPFAWLLLANFTDANREVIVRQAHAWATQLLADQHPKLVEWRESLSFLARAVVLRETNPTLKQRDLTPALGGVLSSLVNAWEPRTLGETPSS